MPPIMIELSLTPEEAAVLVGALDNLKGDIIELNGRSDPADPETIYRISDFASPNNGPWSEEINNLGINAVSLDDLITKLHKAGGWEW